MGWLWQEAKGAVRGLVIHPASTIVVILTLGVCIGLNATVFSAVDAVLLKPLPVAEPDRLVRVYSSAPDDFMSHSPIAPGDFEDLRQGTKRFARWAGWFYTPLALDVGPEPSLVLGELVTEDYFGTLGVVPAMGRAFTKQEVARAEAVALLSHRAWQRRFGGDPDVVGRTVRINRLACTVIGVLPRSFFGMTRGVSPELWVPLTIRERLTGSSEDSTATLSMTDRQGRWLWAIGRLTPGATIAQAESEVAEVGRQLAAAFPETNRDRRLLAVPGDRVRVLPSVDTRLSVPSLLAMAIVTLVLGIAGANLASLQLARSVRRRSEFATRRALGAGTFAIVRLLLVESLLLAAAGGVVALALAALAIAALRQLRLPVPVDVAIGQSLDLRVFGFTLLLAVASAFAIGLTPAVAASKARLTVQLAGTSAPSRRRGRNLLVVAQVALCLMLLAAAGLAFRSLSAASRTDPGFEAEGVVVATLAPHLQGYAPVASELMLQRLIEQLRSSPEIEAAALASHLPLSLELTFHRLRSADEASSPREGWYEVDAARVGPGYFEALGAPLRRGRGFQPRDDAGADDVAVINATLAERLWPGEDPLGRALEVEGAKGKWRVVGVARNGKYRALGEAPRSFVYRPRAQAATDTSAGAGNVFVGATTVIARARSGESKALEVLWRALDQAAPGVAASRISTLDEAIGVSLLAPRATAALFGFFGVLGLLLASLGLYGILAHDVSQRRRELGVRIALGARSLDLVQHVLGRGLRLVLSGVALGLGGALATTWTLRSLLFGVGALDPLTFVVVPGLLVSVALVACWLPARRAARVNPVESLRS